MREKITAMKIFRCLLLLYIGVCSSWICAHAHSLKLTTADTLPPTRLNYTALYVRDVAALKTWYEEKLGFKTLEFNTSENGFGFAMLEGYNTWIEMIQNPSVVGRAQFSAKFATAIGTHGFFKLGLQVEDIEGKFQELKAKGLKFKYELMNNARFKMRLFIVEDVEGNGLQFYEFY